MGTNAYSPSATRGRSMRPAPWMMEDQESGVQQGWIPVAIISRGNLATASWRFAKVG